MKYLRNYKESKKKKYARVELKLIWRIMVINFDSDSK